MKLSLSVSRDISREVNKRAVVACADCLELMSVGVSDV